MAWGNIPSASSSSHLRLSDPERIFLCFISFHELLFCKSSSSLSPSDSWRVHSVPQWTISEFCYMCEEHLFYLVLTHMLANFGASQFLCWVLCKQIIHSSPTAQHSGFWRVLSYPFLLIFLPYFTASYNAAVLGLWSYLSFLFISFQIVCSLNGSEEIGVMVGNCVLFSVLATFLTPSLPLDACQNQLWYCH